MVILPFAAAQYSFITFPVNHDPVQKYGCAHQPVPSEMQTRRIITSFASPRSQTDGSNFSAFNGDITTQASFS